MQKRVIYLILVIIFLTTTIVQSFGNALAMVVNEETVTANTTSKIVDPRSAIKAIADSSHLESGSSRVSALTGQSGVQSQTKQSVEKSSSNSQSRNVSDPSKNNTINKKKSAESKSILIQPRVIGEKYPDFSKSLIGQSGVTAVDPTNTTEEIAYPNNAFPNYIPGVSSQTIHGLTMDENGIIDGSQLDGTENHNIYYSKVMSYTDSNNKHHWIDIKESFIALDKRGWNVGLGNFKPTTKFAWNFTTGLGDKTNGAMPGMLGIANTLGTQGVKAFYPAAGKYTSGKSGTGTPPDLHDFNQPVKVKLDFIDNATKQPINISGFLTLGDMDHRNYIEFSKSDNLSKVYVTNDSLLKGTTTDPNLTRIVNGLGNWDYTPNSTNGTALSGDYDDKGNSVTRDIIKPNNTRAWATVVFDNVNTLDYTVNDTGELDFLASALVPVAFSAPAKDGDGDEYNSKWDDQTIQFNMVATLPYRGSTIHDPQKPDTDTDPGSTISTFKQSTKFELTDPIDSNLKVDTVKVLNQLGNDVSNQFTIKTTNNKVVATATTAFLADEKNYAQPYTLEIDTTVKAGADLSAYQQVDANNNTYAMIPNTGHMSVIKKAGAAEETFDSNVAYGHVKTPKVVKVTATKQVKNITQNEATYADKTEAMNGDQVSYLATFKVATADKTIAAGTVIKDVLDKHLTVAAKAVKVTYFDAKGTALGTENVDFDSNHELKTTKEVPAGGSITVELTAMVKDDGTTTEIDNTMNISGPSLSAPTDTNKAVINVKPDVTVDSPITQVVQNKTQNGAKDTEITGNVNDTVLYTFSAKMTAVKATQISNVVFTTKENDSSRTDSSGELTEDKTGDFMYRVIRGTTASAWVATTGEAIKDGDGFKISVPTIKLDAGVNQVEVMYYRKIKTTPDNQKYIYNDGQIQIGASKAIPSNYTRIKLGEGETVIRYVDLDEDLANPDKQPTQIAPSVSAKGMPGKAFSTVNAERVAPKVIDDYTVIAVTEDEDLTAAQWKAAYKDDPLFSSKKRVLTYGYKKRMIGIEAPKYWNFGNYNRTQSDQTYYLDPNGKPQKVTVTDNYGVKDWSLQVSQPRQFTDDRKQELKDAQLRFKNGTVSQETVANGEENAKNHGTLDSVAEFSLTPGDPTATTLMHFTKKGIYQKDNLADDKSSATTPYDNPGVGVWHYNFGNQKTAGSSIGLHVPATTKRDNTTYQAVLEWSMAVAP